MADIAVIPVKNIRYIIIVIIITGSTIKYNRRYIKKVSVLNIKGKVLIEIGSFGRILNSYCAVFVSSGDKNLLFFLDIWCQKVIQMPFGVDI
jgi:hypothetical protein